MLWSSIHSYLSMPWTRSPQANDDDEAAKKARKEAVGDAFATYKTDWQAAEEARANKKAYAEFKDAKVPPEALPFLRQARAHHRAALKLLEQCTPEDNATIDFQKLIGFYLCLKYRLQEHPHYKIAHDQIKQFAVFPQSGAEVASIRIDEVFLKSLQVPVRVLVLSWCMGVILVCAVDGDRVRC